MFTQTIASTMTAAASSVPAHADEASRILIQNPAGVLAALLTCLAVIFWLTQHRVFGKVFKVVPALVFCYFVPTTLTSLSIIPAESPLYKWIKAFVLPAALLLLILALDVPGILRLGPKAIIMLLAGTTGVVLGAPLALLICKGILPPDAWRGMTALSGSWIGGGANFVALGDIAGASSSMMAIMVIPDVLVASIWMGVLLYLSGQQHTIDRWTGANAAAIRDLETRLTDFQERVNRVPSLPDLMIIVAFGFGVSWISYALGVRLFDETFGYMQYVAADIVANPADLAPMKPHQVNAAVVAALKADAGALDALSVWQRMWFETSRFLAVNIGSGTWKYVLLTTIGVGLSFTPARNLEGAGASKIGSVLLYLLVACIGASADFREIIKQPPYIAMAAIWMSVHIGLLLLVAWLIRAPIFFVAVGSQANIGGAASAPVVAAAFHPSLAPVGALLAVAGYVLGTYAGLVCMRMLMAVAGAAPPG